MVVFLISSFLISPAAMAIEIEHYVPPSVTQEPCKLTIIPSEHDLPVVVDYADLPIIDLSKGPRPEEVREAMQTYGFFYVVGHGLSLSEVHAPGIFYYH